MCICVCIAAGLYIDQNKTCALSGLEIGWAEVGQDHTASIDRIDSTKGYTLRNIQLVHKDINMMKQQYTNQYFIDTVATQYSANWKQFYSLYKSAVDSITIC